MYGYMAKPQTSKEINIPDNVLRKLLTPSELRMLKNRFYVVNLLEEGLPIRQIAEQAKVGTDTVVRVARMVESGQLQKVMGKTKKANKNSRVVNTKVSWIFGKSDV